MNRSRQRVDAVAAAAAAAAIIIPLRQRFITVNTRKGAPGRLSVPTH